MNDVSLCPHCCETSPAPEIKGPRGLSGAYISEPRGCDRDVGPASAVTLSAPGTEAPVSGMLSYAALVFGFESRSLFQYPLLTT